MEKFRIHIPEPCHEDWAQMSLNKKGRFCSSCQKTVVDFTGMNETEIQTYFKENWQKSICGHFYSHQVGTNGIVIQIREQDLMQNRSIYQMVLIAIFIAMGTTLFSCKNEKGDAVPIDKIEIVQDSIQNSTAIEKIDSTQLETGEAVADTISSSHQKQKCDTINKNSKIQLPSTLDGVVKVDIPNPPTIPQTTTGEVAEIPPKIEIPDFPEKNNRNIENAPSLTMGRIDTSLGCRLIGKMAIYPGVKEVGNKSKMIKAFSDSLNQDVTWFLDLDYPDWADHQKQVKAEVQFIIDTTGRIVDIKATKGDVKYKPIAEEALQKTADWLWKKHRKIKPAELEDGTKVPLKFSTIIGLQNPNDSIQ